MPLKRVVSLVGVIVPGADFLIPIAPRPARNLPPMLKRSNVRASGPEGVGLNFFAQ